MTRRGAVLLGALAACTEPRPSAPDVLLLTLDTVRADHMPLFGGDAARAPNFAEWLEDGRRFATAYTSAPLTVPAHASLLSGSYAHTHGVRQQFPTAVPSLLLVDAARRSGYDTAAFVAGQILAPDHSRFAGFSHFDAPDGPERPASVVIAAALDWLAGRPSGRPLFLWVHLFDAHFPYAPAEPAWERCPVSVRPLVLDRVRLLARAPNTAIALFSEPWWPACLDDLYTGEIAGIDAALPPLREGLARRGSVVWVIAGDHGECLGEEGILAQHGGSLQECALRIPLAIGGLARTPAGEDRRLASLVDVAPTLARALGLDLGPVEGVDLLGPDLPGRAVRFEAAGIAVPGLTRPLLGGRVGTEKVVYDPTSGSIEAVRLSDQRALKMEDLSAAARSLIAELRQSSPPPAGTKPQPADLELLRSLGYVE